MALKYSAKADSERRNSRSAFRAIAVSIAGIVLAGVAVVAGSYALFTDEVRISNHLVAGKMEATLERTGYTVTRLNKEGYLETIERDESGKPVDFTGSTDLNIFGMSDEEKIVPGSSYSATMLLSNESDAAFGYWLELRITEGADTALAQQLVLEVDLPGTGNDEKVYFSEISGSVLSLGSESNALSEVGLKQSQSFTVTVAFESLDGGENDKAQDQELAFDLVVYAVQVTA